MSQEKVDRYKKEKANRKQIMRKAKITNVLCKFVVCIVAVALIGWISYSAYGKFTDNKEQESIEVDYTAFTELSQNLAEAAE